MELKAGCLVGLSNEERSQWLNLIMSKTSSFHGTSNSMLQVGHHSVIALSLSSVSLSVSSPCLSVCRSVCLSLSLSLPPSLSLHPFLSLCLFPPLSLYVSMSVCQSVLPVFFSGFLIVLFVSSLNFSE